LGTLEALAHLSQQSVESGSYMMHENVLEQFTNQAKCLRRPVPVEPWAAILVSQAIILNRNGGDWSPVLASAMAADPSTWVPPELLQNGIPRLNAVPENAANVPPGMMLWLDGKQYSKVPQVAGLHIVQMQKMESFATTIGTLPFDIPTTIEVEEPEDLASGKKSKNKPTRAPSTGTPGANSHPVIAHGGLQLGLASASQKTDVPREYIGDDSNAGLSFGITGQVLVAIPDVPVRGWGALAMAPGRSGGFELGLGAGLDLGDIIPFGGIGMSGVRISEAGVGRKPLLGTPRVGVRYGPDMVPGLDVSAQVGLMPAASFFQFGAGFAPVDLGFGAVRGGLDISTSSGRFAQPEQDWRKISASRVRFGLHVGIALGHGARS